LGRGFIASIQDDFEILPLAHVLHAFVTHLAERAVDGLALRIQHRLLERHVNVSLHERKIIPVVPNLIYDRFLPGAQMHFASAPKKPDNLFPRRSATHSTGYSPISTRFCFCRPDKFLTEERTSMPIPGRIALLFSALTL